MGCGRVGLWVRLSRIAMGRVSLFEIVSIAFNLLSLGKQVPMRLNGKITSSLVVSGVLLIAGCSGSGGSGSGSANCGLCGGPVLPPANEWTW